MSRRTCIKNTPNNNFSLLKISFLWWFFCTFFFQSKWRKFVCLFVFLGYLYKSRAIVRNFQYIFQLHRYIAYKKQSSCHIYIYIYRNASKIGIHYHSLFLKMTRTVMKFIYVFKIRRNISCIIYFHYIMHRFLQIYTKSLNTLQLLP